MVDMAIRVDDLGKQYRIGQREPYRTLRDSVARLARAPVAFLRGEGRGCPENTIWALRHVSFEVKCGEVVGVVGRNGAGKSTLLKILSQITEPTTGQVDLYGRVGSLLEVGTGFHPELTGRENIYLNGAILGMKRRQIERQFDAIVTFAELEKFLDTPVKYYSSGMYVRLAFAVAAHLEPDILIIDEVLAVGDAAFQQKCLGKMNSVSKTGRTILFVSHNMGLIENLCSKAILLDHGEIKVCGHLQSVLNSYLREIQDESTEFESGPVKFLSIRQHGDTIAIVADYELSVSAAVVCLGFVISDHLGQPICGGNPLTTGHPDFGKGMQRGRITITIREPKLLDGTYRLSIWFGDGKSDSLVEKDCVVFRVANMVSHRQYSPAIVGCVSPVCTWNLQ